MIAVCLCAYLAGILWLPTSAAGLTQNVNDFNSTAVEDDLGQLIESLPWRIQNDLGTSGALDCPPYDEVQSYSAKLYGLETAITVMDHGTDLVQGPAEEEEHEIEKPIKCFCNRYTFRCFQYSCYANIKVDWLRILLDAGESRGEFWLTTLSNT